MCGIAGAFSRRDVDVPDIRPCLDLAGYRGPDAVGSFRGIGCILGQNRLAVMDPARGDPPLTNSDGTCAAVLNGEVYNFRGLRAELVAAGHRLGTYCDTEVLVHLTEGLGPGDLAKRLEGMFAFAVWDGNARRLTLGRDRLGKKPLYYWSDGSRLVFGSEIKSVLAHPWVPRRLDEEALSDYLEFGYVPTPWTFFEGVVSLPPGCVLTASDEGQAVEPYWRLDAPAAGDLLDVGLPEAAEQVRRLVRQAVVDRMAADVPLGAFLSGGLDSSAVVATMVEASAGPVRTFTAGFADAAFDERPHARRVATVLGTDHTELTVEPPGPEVVERLVHHYDQPFGDSSSLPTYLLSDLTRQHVTVALSGDGGDECFAGYRRLWLGAGLASVPGRRLLDRLPSGSGRRERGPGPLSAAFRATSGLRQGMPDAMARWAGYVSPELRRELLGTDGEGRGLADYRAIWDRSAGAPPLQRALHLNASTYLLDDLLPKVDRMSMAHALEVRSPLLDHRLVEYALRLPARLQLGARGGKRVLRRAVADLLPEEVLRRPKKGFGVPLSAWMRGHLRPYVDSMLGSASSRVRTCLDPGVVDLLLAEHQRGDADHGHALWSLLTLEVFLRREDW